MLAQIEAINSAVNGVVWGPIMLVLLVGTGIYLTFRTRGRRPALWVYPAQHHRHPVFQG